MPGAAERRRPLRDVVGATHVDGKYNFTHRDFLNEGADALLQLGTRVIKVWFTPAVIANKYHFNSNWPTVNSLVDLAKTPYFRALFAKPFTTFILETYAPGRDDHYYKAGMTAQDKIEEEAKLHDLAAYLLTHYRGTGKTFVLQNWEGDWSVTYAGSPDEPTTTALGGMVDWLNARQAGVERARREHGTHGVQVVHAAEVNLVAKAMAGKGRSVTNDVLPHTACDLYSYSSWDTCNDRSKFPDALSYLASKAPASALYGRNNVYVGEFGAPENNVGGPIRQRDLVANATETALKFGAPYVVYWELYCNEPKTKPLVGRPKNDDMRGFWLIRPDGSRAPVYDYFARLLAGR